MSPHPPCRRRAQVALGNLLMSQQPPTPERAREALAWYAAAAQVRQSDSRWWWWWWGGGGWRKCVVAKCLEARAMGVRRKGMLVRL
jgi:hypothetical protein